MKARVGTKSRDREHALILECARGRLSDRAIARIREIVAGPLDWDYLVAAAEAHGLSALLLTNLKAVGADVPSNVAQHLEQRFIETTALNLTLTAQLIGILQTLRAHGIPALAYKGPALAAAAYGAVGLRSFVDLDIMVPRDAAHDVPALMRANGYAVSYRDYRIYLGYARASRELSFYPDRPGLAKVEMHVAVASWALAVRLDIRELLDRAVPVVVSGTPILTLCPEDLLLVLAVHATTHLWSVLKHISEIDAVVRPDLDWDVTIHRARAARMLRMLSIALLLARDLLETEIPASVVATALRDRGAVTLTREFAARLFAPANNPEGFNGRLRASWLRLRCRERASDKVRFAMRSLACDSFIKRGLAKRLPSRDGAANYWEPT